MSVLLDFEWNISKQALCSYLSIVMFLLLLVGCSMIQPTSCTAPSKYLVETVLPEYAHVIVLLGPMAPISTWYNTWVHQRLFVGCHEPQSILLSCIGSWPERLLVGSLTPEYTNVVLLGAMIHEVFCCPVLFLGGEGIWWVDFERFQHGWWGMWSCLMNLLV